MKYKAKVYHGTDLNGVTGIIKEGFNTEMNCATPCKRYASNYADPYLVSFEYEYEFKFYQLLYFLYYLKFRKQLLTIMVNKEIPSSITIVKLKK